VVGNVKEIDFLISRLQATDGSILGFLTNLNLLKNRVMAKAGNQDALKKVKDAEMINSLTGKEVFELIKALGIGARGLDTPAERKFLRAVLTGTNELTKETLLEMAAERRKIQVRNVEKWNKRSNDGDYDRFYTSTGYIKRPLEVPGPAPVFTSVDISGDISKMNLVQLTAKMVGATKDEKLKIGLRLDALGAK
jgi:predicted oxidoreductase